MRILWYVFSYMTSEPWIESLTDLQEHEVFIARYDKFGIPSDQGFLNAAHRIEPDLIIYTGTAGGPNIPQASTLARLKKIAPLIFLSGDLGDPPWWPYLEDYRAHDAITLTVNYDGNDNWPKVGDDYTTLCPIAPKFFANQKPIVERQIPFGFAGSYSWDDLTDPRRKIIDHLRISGLTVKPWENGYGTYQAFANFLMSCKIVPSMPFSGSGKSRQVKARVIESGLAGCCLLDHVESAAKHWFKPGVDYEEYETAEHAVELTHELLRDPDRMQHRAANLQRRILSKHSPTVFWEKLFSRV